MRMRRKKNNDQNNIVKSLHPRRHPLFPTAAEAAENPKLVCSDHLPILVKMPLQQGSSLNIISLNVLGPGVSASGFHAQDGWEFPEEAKLRYKRLVTGIVKGINNHQVDVVALQEAHPFLIPILKKSLGQDWEIIVDEWTGIITCFNKNKYHLKESSLNKMERIRSLTLCNRTNNELVEVHNVWGNYDAFPDHAENVYKSILTNGECNSIIVGDTNSRIAPIHNNPMNITTGVVPIGINELNGAEENVQITDYPDGGFCYDIKNKSIHQLETAILDYDSGDIVVDTRSAAEIAGWPEFRMILCLDKSYQDCKIIDNNTIFEYENKLKEIVPEDFLVRIAADSYNHKAVAVRFTPESELSDYVMDKLKNIEGIQIRNVAGTKDGINYPIIFVPIEKAELLDNAIKNYQKEIKQYNKNNLQLVKDLKNKIKQNNREINRIGNSKAQANIQKKTDLTNENQQLNELKEFCQLYRHLDPSSSDIMKLYRIKSLIENKQFDKTTLGYFGGIKEDGKLYSTSAYNVKKLIENALNRDSLSDKACNRLFEQIEMELAFKCKTTPSFLGFGGRTESTAKLYRDILGVISTEPKSLSKDSDKSQSINQKPFTNKVKFNFYSRHKKIADLSEEIKKEIPKNK